jgi:V/A-type H+-transporting ATPase subunit C
MALVKETKFIPLGLEVMVAFLAAHEYEVKNLRILLAGKEAGIPTQTIRERIRESYV